MDQLQIVLVVRVAIEAEAGRVVQGGLGFLGGGSLYFFAGIPGRLLQGLTETTIHSCLCLGYGCM